MHFTNNTTVSPNSLENPSSFTPRHWLVTRTPWCLRTANLLQTPPIHPPTVCKSWKCKPPTNLHVLTAFASLLRTCLNNSFVILVLSFFRFLSSLHSVLLHRLLSVSGFRGKRRQRIKTHVIGLICSTAFHLFFFGLQ